MKKLDEGRMEAVAGLLSRPVARDYPLRECTTFRIGGAADIAAFVENVGELQALLRYCTEQQIPWRVLGKGANVLASDDGFRGVILFLGKGFANLEIREDEQHGSTLLRVGAACSLARLLSFCRENAFAGVEFAAGIPGTVGGAVMMNAGAHGAAIGDLIQRVAVMTAQGSRVLGRDTLSFAYRKISGLPENAVVSGVELLLTRGDREEIAQRMESLLKRRMQTQPQGMPNAGSIFRNPPEESAGRLIERCGLKGLRMGGAEVSEKHANFIVNREKAKACDVQRLMEYVQVVVRRESGVQLVPEIHFLS